MVKAVGSASLTQASVFFTKAIAAGSIAASKFQLSGGVAVTAAALVPNDLKRVVLTTAAQSQGTVYTVTVNGVTDDSGTAIAPDSKINFTAWKIATGWATREIYFSINGQSVSDLKDNDRFKARTPDKIEWVKGCVCQTVPTTPTGQPAPCAFDSVPNPKSASTPFWHQRDPHTPRPVLPLHFHGIPLPLLSPPIWRFY